MLYFAFGGNLSTDYIHQSCPSATFHSVYELKGFELYFAGTSKTYGYMGCCNIRHNPLGSVWGVLWDIPANEIPKLDMEEGVGTDYEVGEHNTYERVYSKTESGERFFLYYLVHPRVPNPPRMDYFLTVLEGYEEHGLDIRELNKAYLRSRR